jgi:hypothetical protein
VCAYPWFSAARMALAGLPFYILCLAFGGISIADLLLLYLVFGLIASLVPVCSRPMLADQVAFSLGPPPTAGGLVAGAQPAAVANPAQTQATGNWSAVGMVPIMMFLFTFFSMGGRAGSGAFFSLREYAPESITNLLPLSAFSWPLVFARAHITPFDFYGLPVPPIAFIVVLVMLERYVQIVRGSEYLRVATYRDLYARPSYIPRKRLEGWMKIARAFITIGYTWKWGVANGGLAFVLNPHSQVNNGQMGLLFLLLFSAGWRTCVRAGELGSWSRVDFAEKDEPYRLRLIRSSALAYVIGPFLFSSCGYIAGCALARVSPLPGAAASLSLKMLSISMAGALFIYLSRRTFPRMPTTVILLLPILALFGSPETVRAAAISPAFGMISQSDLIQYLASSSNLFGVASLAGALKHLPPWYLSPLISLAGCVILSTLYPLLQRRTRVLRDERDGIIAVDPTIAGREIYLDPLLEHRTRQGKEDTPQATHLIEFIQRISDNAIVTKELRVRLRGRLGPRELAAFALFLPIATGALMATPSFTSGVGFGLGSMFFGRISDPSGISAAGILTICYMVLGWTALGCGLNLLPQSFAPEREKSTLSFLLTSPLSSIGIVFGKIAGILSPLGLVSMALAIWSLFLTALFAPVLGDGNPFLVWFKVIATAVATTAATGAISIGLAALFPRTINQAGCGFLLFMVLFQAPVQFMIHFNGAAGATSPIAFDGNAIWLLYLGICALTGLLGTTVAIWAVGRMRRRDISFDAARREG